MPTTAIPTTKSKFTPKPPVPDRLLERAAGYAAEAVPWNLQMPYKKHLVIDGPGFQAWVDAELPEAVGLKVDTGVPTTETGYIAVGKFRLYRKLLPRFVYQSRSIGIFMPTFTKPQWGLGSLDLHRYGKPYGFVQFTSDVAFPILADHTWTPWMSLTPAEIMSQRAGLRHARGRVLIGGLGLGWFTREVALKKGVTEVLVVEKAAAVAVQFAKRLATPKVKVTVHLGDAYEFAETNGHKFDSVLFDTWPGVGDAGWDTRWQKLKKKCQAEGRKAWAWGDYEPQY